MCETDRHMCLWVLGHTHLIEAQHGQLDLLVLVLNLLGLGVHLLLPLLRPSPQPQHLHTVVGIHAQNR